MHQQDMGVKYNFNNMVLPRQDQFNVNYVLSIRQY